MPSPLTDITFTVNDEVDIDKYINDINKNMTNLLNNIDGEKDAGVSRIAASNRQFIDDLVDAKYNTLQQMVKNDIYLPSDTIPSKQALINRYTNYIGTINHYIELSSSIPIPILLNLEELSKNPLVLDSPYTRSNRKTIRTVMFGFVILLLLTVLVLWYLSRYTQVLESFNFH
ncbi:hypothetical protein NEOKW01_1877 [Nematocida sp. AWRm80]|nr:hypothetical protein NEOKW01_1877 [Nematocida sp. AWRm80]